LVKLTIPSRFHWDDCAPSRDYGLAAAQTTEAEHSSRAQRGAIRGDDGHHKIGCNPDAAWWSVWDVVQADADANWSISASGSLPVTDFQTPILPKVYSIGGPLRDYDR
jgi:hypothetical protein